MQVVHRDGLCRGHYERRVRGAVVNVELRPRFETAWERFVEAVRAYADADSTDDVAFERAKDRLRKAARAWVTGQRSHRVRDKERRT